MNKRFQILLVRVPEFFFATESVPIEKQIHGAVMVPLGILHLGSYVRHQFSDVDVHYLDLHLKCKASNESKVSSVSVCDIVKLELEKALKDIRPSIVGVSCAFNAFADNFHQTISEIKRIHPDAIVVVGGHYVSSYLGLLPQDNDIDYAVIGEGEIPFTNFIREFKEGIRPQNKIINKKEYLKSLEAFPPLDYDLINIEEYLKHEMNSIGGNQGRSLNMMTARGCPQRCIYCATHNVWDYDFRMQSAQNMFKQIVELKEKYFVETVMFVDDNFLWDKKRIKEFCKLMIDHQVDLNWYPSSVRINSLDEEIISLMKKAGCRSLLLAIESGTKRIQKMIKKNVNLEHTKRMVRCLKQEGFRVYAQYILGFPGETIDEMKQTIQFSQELKCDWNLFGIATPLYGTEMYRIAVDSNYLLPNISVGSFSVGNIVTPEFSNKDVEDLLQDANYRTNFIDNDNFVNERYEEVLPIYESVARSYPEHFVCKYMIWNIYKATNRNEEAKVLYDNLRRLYLEKISYHEELIERYGLKITFDEMQVEMHIKG
jgi:magnesium-protoporphyrin IX monomethyl ester (oxidative) cyclase